MATYRAAPRRGAGTGSAAAVMDIDTPRCMSCARTDCPGIEAVDYCPLWQEAEARNARGEYLPTYPLRLDPEDES